MAARVWILLPMLFGACAAGPAPPPPAAHIGPVTAIVVDAGGATWSCSQAGLRLGRPGRLLPGPRLSFRPTALAAAPASPAPAAVLVGGGDPGRSGVVALVTAEAVRFQRRIADDLVYAVAVDETGTTAAAADAGGTVHVLELPTLRPLAAHRDHTAACRTAAFAPGGLLASGGRDGSLMLRRLDAAAPPRRLVDHTAAVECAAFDAAGERLASGADDGKVRIHHREGRLLRTFARLGAAVTAVGWSSDEVVVAGLADGRVLDLVDAGDGPATLRAAITGPVTALAVTADHCLVGTVGDLVEISSGRTGRPQPAGR